MCVLIRELISFISDTGFAALEEVVWAPVLLTPHQHPKPLPPMKLKREADHSDGIGGLEDDLGGAELDTPVAMGTQVMVLISSWPPRTLASIYPWVTRCYDGGE
jgi:hypothetical protein